MATFRYHVAPERDTPLPPEESLPAVEADEPLDALATVAKLAREGLLPSEPGQTFWVRFVVGHENGKIQAASVPLTVDGRVSIDWR